MQALQKKTAVVLSPSLPKNVKLIKLYTIVAETKYIFVSGGVASSLGKGIISFSPLAQGMLTNRYLNGIPEDSRIRTDGRFLKESSVTPEYISKVRAKSGY